MTAASAVLVDRQTNVVENHIVVNIDKDRKIIGWVPPEGYDVFVLPDGSEVGIGWGYDRGDETFIVPPQPEPDPAQQQDGSEIGTESLDE